MVLLIAAVVMTTVALTVVTMFKTIDYLKQTKSDRAVLAGCAVSAVMTTGNAISSLVAGTYFVFLLLPLTATIWAMTAAWVYDIWRNRQSKSTNVS